MGFTDAGTKESGQVLGWAVDFPAETTGRAMATLAREGKAKHGRVGPLPDAVLDEVPQWKDMISRASNAASGTGRDFAGRA